MRRLSANLYLGMHVSFSCVTCLIRLFPLVLCSALFQLYDDLLRILE